MNKLIIPIPKPVREVPKTKEQFMIDWVLARASFKDSFDGHLAAIEAARVWDAIQKLK
jgi:hypothetical protein